MAKIFEQLAKGKSVFAKAGQGAKDAWTWFKGNIKNLILANNTNEIFNMYKGKYQNKLDKDSLGHLYMFIYEAKYRKTLPYYDQFPVIFPIKFYPNGFLGLNLHYLPPKLRAVLMDAIFKTMKEDTPKKRKPSVEQVLDAFSRLSYFKPCVKRYIYPKHVKSKFIKIPVDDWDFVIMLNTERFVSHKNSRGVQKPFNKRTVWEDSLKKIG